MILYYTKIMRKLIYIFLFILAILGSISLATTIDINASEAPNKIEFTLEDENLNEQTIYNGDGSISKITVTQIPTVMPKGIGSILLGHGTKSYIIKADTYRNF